MCIAKYFYVTLVLEANYDMVSTYSLNLLYTYLKSQFIHFATVKRLTN